MKKTFYTLFFLLTTDAVLSASQLKVEADGLKLSVAAFQVDGLDYTGGEIVTFPNKRQFLVLNLHTKALYLLERSIGDESLLLAELKTDEHEVTGLDVKELALPPTRIPKTLKRLEDGDALRVHSFGSSLVAAGRSSFGWEQILFNPEFLKDRLSVLNSDSYELVSTKNYGVGGTNSRYSIALMGEGINGEARYATSAYDCDLAIVALIPNGGADRLPVFEGVVRQLRQRGIEVLLLTDNSMAKKGRASGLWGSGLFVKEMAEKYGCAIADTAAYMLYDETRGKKVYVDSIHSSRLGHRSWALAASGALTPITGQPDGAFTPADDVATIQNSDHVPGRVLVDFHTENEGGEYKAPVGANGLARAYGIDPPASLILESGDSFRLNQDGSIAADLILDVSSGFTAEIIDLQSGEVFKEMKYKAPKIGSRPQAKPVFAASELSEPMDAERFELRVSTGSLRLYAVSYQFK